MIRFGWNAEGRLSKRAWSTASWSLSFSALVGVAVAALVVFNLTKDNTAMSMIVAGVLTAILFYVQYRYAQLAVKRLHDRGLSGWLYLPMMIGGIAVLGYAAYAFMTAFYEGGLFTFIGHLMGLLQPIGALAFNGMGLTGAVLVLLYVIFINFNLGAEGTPGDNRFGEAAS